MKVDNLFYNIGDLKVKEITAKAGVASFDDVLDKSMKLNSLRPFKQAQDELKSWHNTMLYFELQSELNRAFFASYGMGDKTKSDPFSQMRRINDLAKKLKQL